VYGYLRQQLAAQNAAAAANAYQAEIQTVHEAMFNSLDMIGVSQDLGVIPDASRKERR